MDWEPKVPCHISRYISSRRDCSKICMSGKIFTHFNLLTQNIPVFEKSEKEQVFNYRSISLTGLLVKSQVKFDNINQFLRLRNSTHVHFSHTGMASSLLLPIATNPSFAGTCEIRALVERQTGDVVPLRYTSTKLSIHFTEPHYCKVKKSWYNRFSSLAVA